MHDCTRCGRPVDGLSCVHCGYAEKGEGGTREYGWCDWRSDGDRCRYPGTMSTATLGGGQWYCSAHFDCHDPVFGAQVVEVSKRACGLWPDYSAAGRRGMTKRADAPVPVPAEVRAALAASKIGRGQKDPKAWARRLLERADRGEQVPMYSLRLAQEVVGPRVLSAEQIEAQAERAAIQQEGQQ